MLVIGSKKEHFNSVWVKNEWSRFLALMEKDRSRLLIPCYRDMDAYDIPDELSMLQSQDMSKIGFIQDLLRGIKKVLRGEKTSAKPTTSDKGDTNVAPLMKRIAIFLETGDFEQANEYCNKVLDREPENADAYLFQLLAQYKLKSEDELFTLPYDFTGQKSYQLLMKFADAQLKARMQAHVKKQKAELRYQELVTRLQNDRALRLLNSKTKIDRFQDFCEAFEALGNYRDSDKLKLQCEEAIEAIRQHEYDAYNQEYERCVAMTKGASSAEEWEAQAKRFHALSDVVPEAVEMTRQCEENARIIRYNNALALKNEKKYEEAIQRFAELNGYSDSEQQVLDCGYCEAMEFKNAKSYTEAIQRFSELNGYGDSGQQIAQCLSLIVQERKKKNNLVTGDSFAIYNTRWYAYLS